MKKFNFLKYLAFLPVFITLGFFMFSGPVFAAYTDTKDISVPVELTNPLKINSLPEFINAILNIVMILMVPIIVFFIIYAGFRYVMAQGNASQVEEATKSLTYAVIGGVLILGAVAIAEIIKNLVAAFAATP
jgi:hypothetical protein